LPVLKKDSAQKWHTAKSAVKPGGVKMSDRIQQLGAVFATHGCDFMSQRDLPFAGNLAKFEVWLEDCQLRIHKAAHGEVFLDLEEINALTEAVFKIRNVLGYGDQLFYFALKSAKAMANSLRKMVADENYTSKSCKNQYDCIKLIVDKLLGGEDRNSRPILSTIRKDGDSSRNYHVCEIIYELLRISMMITRRTDIDEHDRMFLKIQGIFATQTPPGIADRFYRDRAGF